MKPKVILLLAVLIKISMGCQNDNSIVVSGRLLNFSDSTLNIAYRMNPITGLKPTGYQEFISVNEGSFSVRFDVESPLDLLFYSNDYKTVFDLLLVTPGELSILKDCDSSTESIEFAGENGNLNKFYLKWDKYYNNELRNIKRLIDSEELYTKGLDSLQIISTRMLNDFQKNHNLSNKELIWINSDITYRKFVSLLLRPFEIGMNIEEYAYDFFNNLDLDDYNATSINSKYNTLLFRYMLYVVNSQGFQYSTENDNLQYYRKFYELINSELNNQVRDVILTWFVANLLDSNDEYADLFYQKYLADCKSKDIIKKTVPLYNRYIDLTAMELPKLVTEFRTNEAPPEQVLMQFKGKVVYLGFWASWCSPCIKSIPEIIMLADEFKNDELIVVFVGNNDERNKIINAIKKYNIIGNHIILNNLESAAWREYFSISSIPSYVLIDKYGNIVEDNAPGPENKELNTKINRLISE